jgi:hypothetical protein
MRKCVVISGEFQRAKKNYEEILTMKKALLFTVLALLAGAAILQADPRPLKIFLSPASNVPKAEVMKNLSDKCPNVTITNDSKKSDFMVEARFAPYRDRYEFTVQKKGGDYVYSTQTTLLHNAVKDVCHYINTHPPENERAGSE